MGMASGSARVAVERKGLIEAVRGAAAQGALPLT